MEINGAIVDRVGTQVDPDRDVVRVDGRTVHTPHSTISLILNKPRGVLVTLSDPWGRHTIASIVDGMPERVFPVGRLDKESEGLLLLTNDGELAHRVAHPRFGLTKTYLVTVSGRVGREDLSHLESGIVLRDGAARAQSARLVRQGGGRSDVEIVLAEGRKREIRRMMGRLGFEVESLVRTALGGIRLGNLGAGEWRRLTSAEVEGLRLAVGLQEKTENRQ